jgi:osmotically-inducible protein OsmY
MSTAQLPTEVPRRPLSKSARDQLIQTAVAAALDEVGYRCMSRLHVEVFDGVVVLEGIVPSFYMKQLAQEVVLNLDFASKVENRVDVEWPKD